MSIWQVGVIPIHGDVEETCKANEENEAPKRKKDHCNSLHVANVTVAVTGVQ